MLKCIMLCITWHKGYPFPFSLRVNDHGNVISLPIAINPRH